MTAKPVKVIDLVPGTIQSLVTVDAASITEETFWNEFVCKHTPVLVKGAAKHWPALENWKNPEYLESLCADEQVGISRTFNPLPASAYVQSAFQFRKLKESLVEMRASSDDATYSIPGMGVPEKWTEDLGDLSFLKKNDHQPRLYPRRRLFVYKNASTEWHHHQTDESLTTQLVGVKRFSLFRLTPEVWGRYVEPIQANFHHMACGPQFFPQDATLIKFEAIVEPGDTIYIPPFWWHGVDPIDTELGMTLAHCFRTPLRRFGSWQEPATHIMLQQQWAWRKRSVIPTLSLVALSHASRYFAREKWHLMQTP